MPRKKPPADHVISDEVAQTALSLQLNARLFVPVPAELRRTLAAENGGIVPSYADLAERAREASTGTEDAAWEREWQAVGEQRGAARAGETMWSGPFLRPGERVTVVSKAEAEAKLAALAARPVTGTEEER